MKTVSKSSWLHACLCAQYECGITEQEAFPEDSALRLPYASHTITKVWRGTAPHTILGSNTSSRNLFLKLNPDHFHSLQALVCRFSTIRLKEGRAYKIRHLQSIATRCEVCISIHKGCLGSLEPCNVTTGDICGWIFSRPLSLCIFPLANACLLKIPPFTLWVRQNRVNCRLIKPVSVSVVLTVHSGEDKVTIFLRSLAGFEIISSTWRLP